MSNSVYYSQQRRNPIDVAFSYTDARYFKEENTMKIINTMSIEEALELVGYDLSQCDDEGAYIDDDGEQFWIEDCEEADED